MSRGQKRRTPAYFPRMRYRARKRHSRRPFAVLVRLWDATSGTGWIPIGYLAKDSAIRFGNRTLTVESAPLWVEDTDV